MGVTPVRSPHPRRNAISPLGDHVWCALAQTLCDDRPWLGPSTCVRAALPSRDQTSGWDAVRKAGQPVSHPGLRRHRGPARAVERYGDVLATQRVLLRAANSCGSATRTPVIIAVVRIWRPCPSTPAGSIALEPHPTSSRWHATWDIPLASSG
jgi:hypothetical protein